MRKLSMDELDRLSVEDFKAAPKNKVIVVLDSVRSLNNVGSAFRTGDAFCIERIALCGITGTPPHRDIHKTALGAEETVDWQYFNTTAEAIQQLKDTGYKVYAVEQVQGATMLHKFSVEAEEAVAFVFGNEAFGVEEAVLPLCDGCIEIPQLGMKHSLNISVTVGIVLWHVLQNRFD